MSTIGTVNVLKFGKLVACQTAQTQKKQFDEGLPCLLFQQTLFDFQP